MSSWAILTITALHIVLIKPASILARLFWYSFVLLIFLGTFRWMAYPTIDYKGPRLKNVIVIENQGNPYREFPFNFYIIVKMWALISKMYPVIVSKWPPKVKPSNFRPASLKPTNLNFFIWIWKLFSEYLRKRNRSDYLSINIKQMQ